MIAFLIGRTSQRVRNARRDRKPVASFSEHGARLRQPFDDSTRDVEWRDIDAVFVTRKWGRTKLWIEGRLRDFGEYVHYEIDDIHPLPELNANLLRLRPPRRSERSPR
jgi:hypothetical protein